ncbi:MAG: geranylgeranyl reductase family protein [Candidatus Njordarchaeales archaeon]
MTSKFDYDVVIAGASIAGSTLALLLAKEGLSVALIDMKPREKIGEKVCGDGISASYFDKLGIPKPSGPELASVIHASEVIAPDREHILTVEGLGYTIDRWHLNQRLVNDAEKKGTHVLDSMLVIGPLVEGEEVRGVRVRDLKSGEEKEIRGKVTVDATGFAAVIRKRLPEGMLIENDIERFDVAAAYREIVMSDDDYPWPSDRIYIYLSHKFAPGGYTWIFPKGKNVANIGLGIQPLPDAPKAVALLEKFKRFWDIKVSKVLHAGGGVVPVRRALSQLVSNGLLLVGDAASQANPLHGGGMGQAMIAAKIASEVISSNVEGEKVLTKEELWEYAVRYMRSDGAKNAALEIIRLLLQGMTDKEINFIIEKKIVSGEELLAIESTSKESEVVWRKILRIILTRKIRLLGRLKKARDLYYLIRGHFQNYPENPQDLPAWHEKTTQIIMEARKKLWRSPLQHTFYKQ